MSHVELPEELLWQEGHASELALTALADGEGAIVARAVQSHVDACAFCTHRLGETALLSMGASRAITELGPLLRMTPVPERAAASESGRKRLPWPMLVAALAIAVLGAVPTLIRLPTRAGELCFALLHTLPTLSRSSAQLLRSGLGPSPVWVGITCACAVVLVMTSYAVTRLLPKPVTR
jgi:hypothetical protein